MSQRNGLIWNAIKVICWVIFIGLCIQTGTLLFNYIYSLFRPVATHDLYSGLDLSDLYNKSTTLYGVLFHLFIVSSALKAVLFYLVIKMLGKLNFVKPFSEDVSEFISRITFLAFTIGGIGIITHQLIKKLIARGYDIATAYDLSDDWGAYLMMAAILYVIALIFRKGIELQNESELTV